MKYFKALPSALTVLIACVAPLSAQINGSLTVANCMAAGITVTTTAIDWLPAGGGTGCIVTGTLTNVTYSGGSLGASVYGLIKDLSLMGGGPVDQFMTFPSTPLDFVLTSLGPGVLNTICTNTFDPAQPACSPVANSPFILSPGPTGTTVSLSARGNVTDGTSPASTWLGAFTTQFAGKTPFDLQSTVLSGQPLSNTYSGSFIVTAPPPPGRTCTLTQGGYKNHFNDLVLNFPGVPPGSLGLTLGTVFYTDAQLNEILQNNAVKGNGLISLAHQLITAELNLSYGAIPSNPAQLLTLTNAIAAANTLIGGLVIPPIGSGFLSPSLTSGVESILDSYNQGNLGAPHCGDDTAQ